MYIFDKLATLSGYAQTVSMHTLLLHHRITNGIRQQCRAPDTLHYISNAQQPLEQKQNPDPDSSGQCYWQTAASRLLFLFFFCVVNSNVIIVNNSYAKGKASTAKQISLGSLLGKKKVIGKRGPVH